MVALGAYSHAALKDLVRSTGIEYQRLEARHCPLLHQTSNPLTPPATPPS
jgi:hypothetical protein